MTVLGHSDEFGQACAGFWGSGLLGRGNLKSTGSEVENELSLATWGVAGNEAGKSKSRRGGYLDLSVL